VPGGTPGIDFSDDPVLDRDTGSLSGLTLIYCCRNATPEKSRREALAPDRSVARTSQCVFDVSLASGAVELNGVDEWALLRDVW